MALRYSDWAPTAEAAFLAGFSTETTPRQAARIDDFRAYYDAGTRVNVTFLVGSDFEETLQTAVRLRRQGFVPVPHLSARLIPSRAAFEEMLRRLTAEAGVDEVLAIAGGCKLARGPFQSSIELFETGLFERYGIRRLGVAGHPEGSPDIPPQAAAEALAWKNAYAEETGAELYIVSQFCFDVQALIRWERVIRQAGNRLPIRVGIAGPATLRTLVSYATTCGVGPSMRVLTRQAGNLKALTTPTTPDRLVSALAAHKAAEPESLIVGAHVFPLGGIAKTANWLNDVLGARDNAVPVRGGGFGA